MTIIKFLKRLIYPITQQKYITLRGVTIKTYIRWDKVDEMNFLFYPSQEKIKKEMQKQKDKANELRLSIHNC